MAMGPRLVRSIEESCRESGQPDDKEGCLICLVNGREGSRRTVPVRSGSLGKSRRGNGKCEGERGHTKECCRTHRPVSHHLTFVGTLRWVLLPQ
jgi:hypothetical protein